MSFRWPARPGRQTLTNIFEKPWSGLGIGGGLSPDFVNTVDWRLREPPVELLKEFSDLLKWGWSTGIVTLQEARKLKAWGESHPRAAAQALAEAREVREAIAGAFQAVARGEALPPMSLARIDEACRAAWAARTLKPAGKGGAAWTWRDDSSTPHRIAWSAALDAARILTSEDRERLSECGDAQCGWLFLDTSRNRSRRWCTMQGCGNRNKARNFYKRSTGRRSS